MAMTMTQIVCDHIANKPRSEKIGDVYMRDFNGELQLLRAGQRIIKKEFGHYYWRAGTVDCYVVKFKRNCYEVKL